MTNDAILHEKLNVGLPWRKQQSTRRLFIEKFTHIWRRNYCSAAFGVQPFVVLKIGHCGKYIRNTWKVLNFGAGEAGVRSVVPVVWKMKYCIDSRRNGIFYVQC